MRSVRAFTLIELMVVISIISLLSSIVLASVNTARAKARDARRLSDMHNIQIALELYRQTNNQYPNGSSLLSNTASWDTLKSLLAPYMPQVPVDPINDADNNYEYDYTSCCCGTPARLKYFLAIKNLEQSSASNPNFCGGLGGYEWTDGSFE